VFQHLESLDLAAANFAEIARILRPGGTMMIHLPVYVIPPGVPGIALAITTRRRLSDIWAGAKRRFHRPLMRGLRYDWQWLRSTLSSLGLVDVELVFFAVRSNGDYQPCILARKP
jgi:SAM-dependent methyltransferase